MNHTEWLRAAMDARWWALPDGYVRVALTVAALAEDGVLLTRYDQLARRIGVPKTTLRRALEALSGAGFCSVSSRHGRTGETSIVLAERGQLQLTSSIEQTSSFFEETDQLQEAKRTKETGVSGPFGEHLQVSEAIHDSLADQGVHGRFTDRNFSTNPDRKADLFRPDSSQPRARDQDLQRSDLSDLRSPDLQDLTRSREIQMVRNSDGAEESSKELMAHDSDTPETTPTKRSRVDPAKIPERAWAAADYLRTQVMTQNPAAVVGTKPWECGWSWAAGAGVRTGDGSRNGLRLAWANSFRLMQATVHRALKLAAPNTTDEAAWEEIARTVYWLFHGQPVTARFVVESPDSLRDKWDRVQAVRRNQQAKPKDARGADGRPDPQAQRQFKTLDPSDPWGDQSR